MTVTMFDIVIAVAITAIIIVAIAL